MNEENDISSKLPVNCCYSMLNTAFGGPQPIAKNLTNIGEGVYSYTVTVPDEAKASVIGSLMYGSYAKGKIVMKSFECDEGSDSGTGSFSISVEEKIF